MAVITNHELMKMERLGRKGDRYWTANYAEIPIQIIVMKENYIIL